MTLDSPQPELTLTTGNPFPTSGVSTNLSATAYGPTLTGDVTFRDGNTVLGTVPLVEGIASMTVPFAIGIRTLKASLGSIQSPALYLPVSPSTGTCP